MLSVITYIYIILNVFLKCLIRFPCPVFKFLAATINSTYRHALRAYVNREQHAALLLSNYGSVERRRLRGAHRLSGRAVWSRSRDHHRAGTLGRTIYFFVPHWEYLQ